MADKKKKQALPDELTTWLKLNEVIRTADEATCERLLRLERTARNRKLFVLRIHSRLNRVRADRERKELVG